MKSKLNVISFSGGKDSTAMLLRMLEEGMPVDLIIYCDTGLEFPAMYDHIAKVEQNIGREITKLKPERDYEYYFAEHPIERKENTLYAQRYGMNRPGYGWAGPKMRWCTQVLKDHPREKFFSKLKEDYDIIEYVGIAADEGYRLERKCNQRDNMRFPLVEWGMSPPSKELMKLTLEQRIAHGGHPVLHWMMDNIFIRSDPAGNIKPDKEKSTEKIDGAVATIMALDRAIRCGNDTSESVYDTRGLLFI